MTAAEANDHGEGGHAAATRRLIHDLRNEINVVGFACSALRQQLKAPAPDVLRSVERLESAYGRCAALLVEYGKEPES